MAAAAAATADPEGDRLALLESQVERHDGAVMKVLEHLDVMITNEVTRCDAADAEALRAATDKLIAATGLTADECKISATLSFKPAPRPKLDTLHHKRRFWASYVPGGVVW
jgi:hypothetical protein